MEGDVRLNRCSEIARFCDRDATNYCAVHKFLQSAQEKLISGLKKTRIVDICEKKRSPSRAETAAEAV
jgi:DNA-binding IscR family transcriptional regulator